MRGGLLYSLLALTLFAQLALSQTGRADALDWTIHWLDLAAGALVPAFLFHLAIVLSKLKLARRALLVASAYGASALLMLSTRYSARL